uniref:N-acetyltransferase domain-containing protein n=1 Tax=Panagrolaimus sp. PS1159 TaxID=55785 RepID=A0AC35G045_9BILA
MNFHSFRLIRCFRVLNLITKNYSTKIHNPASQLNADKFVYDRNSHLKRSTFIEQKKYGKLPIICEKALPEDDELLTDFFVTHFAHNEPLNATLELSSEEARELMTALIKESTESVILREKDKIIGCHTYKKGRLNEIPRKKKRLEDYGPQVDDGPFKHRKNNIITTILDAAECNMFDKMEPPCTYVYGMMGGIHPKYLSKGIAETTLMETMKNYIKNEDVRYYCGDNTADAIAKLYCKLPGFSVIDKYYYGDFKLHGKPLFDQLIDGSKNTSIILCDLNKWKHVYLKE